MSKAGFWSSQRPSIAASQSLSEFSTSLSNYASFSSSKFSSQSNFSNNRNQNYDNSGNRGTSDFGNSRSFSAPASGGYSNNYNQNHGGGGLQYSNTNNQNRGFSNGSLSNNFGFNNSKQQALSNGANKYFTSSYISNKEKSFDASDSKLFNRRNYSSNQNDSSNNSNNNNQPQNYVPIQQFRQYYNNREQRKNSSSGNREAPPSLFMGKDGSYPIDLNNLMNPFFCALCNARLNSIKSANIHYESKIHDRHITAWLKRTYTDRGLEAPELKRFVTEVTVETPSAYRCELCNLDLSSPQHALQHYNGKRHRNAATKVSPITGIGYFNVEGKWIKTGKVIKATGKEASYILVKTPSGNEPIVLYAAPDVAPTSKKTDSDEPPAKKPHIETPAGAKASNGKESNNQLQAAAASVPKKTPANNTTALANKPTTTVNHQYESLSLDQKESPLQTPQEALQAMNCKICNVSTTSMDQMLLHLKGARHTKKLKALGENPITALFDTPAGTILESLNSNDPSDISMYRTPSGSYYCKPCNAAMQEMAHMKRHISSKKHLVTVKGSQAGGN